MLKFLFERMVEPEVPTWNTTYSPWASQKEDRHNIVNQSVWHWLAGHRSSQKDNGNNKGGSKQSTPKNIEAAPGLIEDLHDESEAVRIDAAYALGALGEEVLPLLQQALREEAQAMAADFSAKMPGNVRGDNPASLYTAEALSEIGEPAIPILIDALTDDHWCVRANAADTLGNIGLPAKVAIPNLITCLDDAHNRVRRHAAEALGRMGEAASSAVSALTSRLTDETMQVRYNAALSLARIEPSANKAVPALTATLMDEDRYVRYFAAVALRRIGTPEANEALLNAMFTGRWCPITTTENMY